MAIKYVSICEQHNLSKDAESLISSALAPAMHSIEYDVYETAWLVEAIEQHAMAFNEDDKSKILDISKVAKYITINIHNGNREFRYIG